jgi:WD40 repeat protein
VGALQRAFCGGWWDESAAIFWCVGGWPGGHRTLRFAVQDDEPAPREPDLVLDNYGGAIAFSPDSKVLAVARGPVGDVEGICFLDAETGKRLPDFEQTTEIGKEGEPSDVLAYSADGKYLAAGGENYVALWDAKSGRRLKNVEPMADREWGAVTALAFTPDSKYVFAGVGFWPLEPRGNADELKGLEPYSSVAFSSDGKHFATRFNGTISLWDLQTRRKLREFGAPALTGGLLEFSPNGRFIASCLVRVDSRPYFLWNVETGEPKYVPFERFPFFDLSPDGFLATAEVPGGVALVRISDGSTAYQLIKQSEVPRKGRKKAANHNVVTEIQFSPNQTIVALSRRLGIRLWKEKNGFKA